MHSDPALFLNDLKAMIAKKVDDALYFLYSEFEHSLWNNEMDELAKILTEIKPEEYPPVMLIGFLVCAQRVSELSKVRTDLFNKIESYLVNDMQMSLNEVSELLSGLEPPT
jgi:hypothetical protein